MEGKTLRYFIITTCIWTVVFMAFIAYASKIVSNMWIFVMAVLGLIILWFLGNTFIIVHFLKKNP